METQKLSFERKQSYEILLGSEVIPEIIGRLARMGFHKRCVVLTNEIVAKWYLEPVLAELRKRNFEAESIIIQDGEANKTLQTASSIYPELMKYELDRRSPLLSLGGGVIGDLGGYVAATFLRGIPSVLFPTTLLAMVDASVGGKVAVNLPEGKNLVGAFYQPSLVGVEISTLQTLPLTQISYGLVECVKHAVIADPAYFKFILKHKGEIKNKDLHLLHRLVRRSINIKKSIVEEDELEKGNRAVLNLGHTFGHALETMGEYRRFHHGEAVGLGMLMAIKAAKTLDILREDFTEGLEHFLADFSLPTRLSREFEIEAMVKAMLRDKKKNIDKINLILPVCLGKVEITPIETSRLPDLLHSVLTNLYN